MKAKNLAELQTALQDFLLNKSQNANDLTLETPTFSRNERLHIYHEAYRLRLVDALRNDYPALETYLGEDKFISIANQFIAAHPSNHPSLRWLGEKLPGFLHSVSVRAHNEYHVHITATELAEFEWAQVMAFDAADEPIVTIDDVRALQPEQWMNMKIDFHSSVHHLKFFSNAPTLWSSLIKAEVLSDADISSEAQHWLVWRDDLQVVYRPLETAESWALTNFLNGQNFADVCGGLCEWFAAEQVPMQAAQFLQQWIRSGLVVKIIA